MHRGLHGGIHRYTSFNILHRYLVWLHSCKVGDMCLLDPCSLHKVKVRSHIDIQRDRHTKNHTEKHTDIQRVVAADELRFCVAVIIRNLFPCPAPNSLRCQIT